MRRVQEIAQQKGVRFFAGGILSSESLAMGKEVQKAGGVFITTAGADEITGKDCNAATFRWSVPTFGAIEQTVRPLTQMLPKAKRWYTITPQYVFGDGLLSAAKAIFKEKGIEHVGNSYHSLAEKEFSGYLTNAAAAQPDVLLILNFGSQSSDTLRHRQLRMSATARSCSRGRRASSSSRRSGPTSATACISARSTGTASIRR